ncbi:MAG: hypothetical protein Q4A48_03985 [Bacillota bacterium]|nr:hypothetical protein [Bacillota bacterium]
MNRCTTKYPIVLIHGIGYSDEENPDYWGPVPGALREEGARVFFGCQSAESPVAENARQLRENIENICKEAETDKVNLIAHSKGGIEARYMISVLGGDRFTASLTTIATPHWGISAIDDMKTKKPRLLSGLYSFFSLITRMAGGKPPKDGKVYDQMSSDYMKIFNELVPDSPGVYYQSYACRMKTPLTDPAFSPFGRIAEKTEGANDGLVTVESAKWGEFRGVYTGPSAGGISHSMVCGDRRPLSWKRKNLDVCEFYVDMVARLKSLGY